MLFVRPPPPPVIWENVEYLKRISTISSSTHSQKWRVQRFCECNTSSGYLDRLAVCHSLAIFSVRVQNWNPASMEKWRMLLCLVSLHRVRRNEDEGAESIKCERWVIWRNTHMDDSVNGISFFDAAWPMCRPLWRVIMRRKQSKYGRH